MTISPIALKEADAREFLGVTDRQWRILKRKGLVAPHPITKSYVRADLERILDGNEEDRRQVRDDENSGGQAALGVRQDAGRSGRRPRAKALALPAPLDDEADVA